MEDSYLQKPSFKHLTVFGYLKGIAKLLRVFLWTARQKSNKLTFQTRCQKSICGSLFLFACGERVRSGSGVLWSQRYLAPCVTCVTMGDHLPPPLHPCGSQGYVGDNINMWELVTNECEQGIRPEFRNTCNFGTKCDHSQSGTWGYIVNILNSMIHPFC